MDNLSPLERSAQMRLVRSKDTKPEMRVRRLVHSLGYRYQIHRSDLPGKPDLVFPSRHRVIQVNGCFWHGHSCRLGRMPKSGLDYWRMKIISNQERDKKSVKSLRKLGWKCLTVWECTLGDEDKLAKRIINFLDPPQKSDLP